MYEISVNMIQLGPQFSPHVFHSLIYNHFNIKSFSCLRIFPMSSAVMIKIYASDAMWPLRLKMIEFLLIKI